MGCSWNVVVGESSFLFWYLSHIEVSAGMFLYMFWYISCWQLFIAIYTCASCSTHSCICAANKCFSLGLFWYLLRWQWFLLEFIAVSLPLGIISCSLLCNLGTIISYRVYFFLIRLITIVSCKAYSGIGYVNNYLVQRLFLCQFC